MFDYTKAAVKKTVEDFKKLDYVRNVATQILYIVYLIYAVCVSAGKLWADIPLLALAVAYFVFFMWVTRGNEDKNVKTLKKTVKRVYIWCKRLVKLFNLIVMTYGIYAATTHVTAVSVIFAAFMIVGWILQIVFEVVLSLFIRRMRFILDGLEADYQKMIKPAKTVGNFFKKLTGKEVEEPAEPTKNRLFLEEKVQEEKQAKAALKAEQKAERKRRKQEKEV